MDEVPLYKPKKRIQFRFKVVACSLLGVDSVLTGSYVSGVVFRVSCFGLKNCRIGVSCCVFRAPNSRFQVSHFVFQVPGVGS